MAALGLRAIAPSFTHFSLISCSTIADTVLWLQARGSCKVGTRNRPARTGMISSTSIAIDIPCALARRQLDISQVDAFSFRASWIPNLRLNSSWMVHSAGKAGRAQRIIPAGHYNSGTPPKISHAANR